MGAAREKDQADFDLERFIDMFDQALTSRDERVVDALRSLMMMVILTKPETHGLGHDRTRGPLRQLFDDVNHLHRKVDRLEHETQRAHREFIESQWGTKTVEDWERKDKSVDSNWDIKYTLGDRDAAAIKSILSSKISKP